MGALTATTLALSTSPAVAGGTYSGRAYVYGADGFRDDWNDEGIVSTGYNRSSNATCLWQKVLWADRLLDASEIDGIFGPDTKAATAAWQNLFGLDDDGVAGYLTWTRAGAFLSDSNGDGAVDRYTGRLGRYANLSRDSDGRYHFYDGDGSARTAGYDYNTCA
ncbi:peptidoglycan-binding domain-containing protein [Streptomyces brasiliscabiei]|uniref:Peptidoglycan-binding domain-containing protein n=1 Tax=Streptomyces brasiliscabiei TaxID=2736302 RepID=A0ABU8GW83_9ACTN